MRTKIYYVEDFKVKNITVKAPSLDHAVQLAVNVMGLDPDSIIELD